MLLLLIPSLTIIMIVLFLLNFYRDPQRKIPKGNHIVAPADGRIINIQKVDKKIITINKGIIGKVKLLTKDINDECYVVSIFMSPFDVHINRAPVSGIIKSIKYTNGKFFRAYNFEKSLQNEKNEIVLQNEKIKVKLIQIAGFLARKIRCYVREKQKVNKGEKIGMIALGSQTTLIIPLGVDLCVKLNDKVKAGETIIAKMK